MAFLHTFYFTGKCKMNTYEILDNHKAETCKLVEWHFTEVTKSIKRKITLKRKFSDPFTCTVNRDLHKDIFYQVFRAIRDYKIQFGTLTEVTRNKKNIVTSYSIFFEHLGSFKYHISKLCKRDKKEIADLYFSKVFSCGSKANIVVTKEKPAVITFKCTRSILTSKCHYTTVNKYGNTTSY